MFRNRQHLSVYDWNRLPEPRPVSTCPECAGPLLPKRGDFLVWHWSHRRTDEYRKCGYGAGETDWHLRWKSAYASAHWLIEARYAVDNPSYQGMELRFDACRAEGRQVLAVREFVNSLSPTYLAKDRAILADGIDIIWIFNAESLGSARVRSVWGRGGYTGVGRLLKPKAYDLASQLAGTVLVHYHDVLWSHWRNNVWYVSSPHRKLWEWYASHQPQTRTVSE